jgi:acyl-CoA thioesterase-1
MRLALIGAILIVLLGLVACGSDDPSASRTTTGPAIVALGDSVTLGLGLDVSESYPARLQRMLKADGFEYEVVNAGVVSLTTARGLEGIDEVLEGDVRFVVVALGGTDAYSGPGFRRQPVSEIRQNLAGIVERVEARGGKVVLAGAEAPLDAEPDYRTELRAAYRDLAQQYELPLIPDLLEGVERVESLTLSDGVHPNAEGTKIVAATVYEVLRPLL